MVRCFSFSAKNQNLQGINFIESGMALLATGFNFYILYLKKENLENRNRWYQGCRRQKHILWKVCLARYADEVKKPLQ